MPVSAPEPCPNHSPKIVGIVNITADSFSDGGCFFAPEAAVARARALAVDGAHFIELGPASSHPDSAEVSAEQEIDRLAPVLDALLADKIPIAIDSWRVETQRYCLARGVQVLNDIDGFAVPQLYPELADADCKLVVMHSVAGRGRATRVEGDASDVLESIYAFFDQRLTAIVAAGVSQSRIILDPGMGFFLGDTPEPSLAVLRDLPRLRRAFGVEVLISVSRKSFLGAITGQPVEGRSAATLAAELFAASYGADYVRTHDAAALRDGLAVWSALSGPITLS